MNSVRMQQRKINECMQLVRIGNRKLNVVRTSDSEGQIHFSKKVEICKELILQKKDFITEAIFEKGGRADILVLEDFKVIEVVDSESEESIIRKQNTYPEGLIIEVVIA